MIRQLSRRLKDLETAAKPAHKSSWAMDNLSREEVAAKLKEYREWFSDPDWPVMQEHGEVCPFLSNCPVGRGGNDQFQ